MIGLCVEFTSKLSPSKKPRPGMEDPASTDHQHYIHHHHQPPADHQVSHVLSYKAAHMIHNQNSYDLCNFPYSHQQNFDFDHQTPSCLPQFLLGNYMWKQYAVTKVEI
ncbi:hypothetical protein ACOSQ3_032058 [Xanthoceras sorbifolium]